MGTKSKNGNETKNGNKIKKWEQKQNQKINQLIYKWEQNPFSCCFDSLYVQCTCH